MVNNESVEQESLFWQAFHYAPIGMALISLDGKVLKVNPIACSLLGYNEDELRCMYMDDYTHPDDLELNICLKREVLEGIRDSYSLEKRLYHKYGHIISVLLTITLVRDKNHSPLFFISQIQDISKQKKTEENLLEIKKQYKLITENSVDIIGKYDSFIRLRYISQSCFEITGYTPDEIIGKCVLDLCHPDDIEEILENHRNMVNFAETRRLCYRVKHKNGHYIWLETTAQAIFDENNHLVEVLSFSRNVTDRKNYEMQIKESEERYKSLFENHPDVTFSLDLEGNFTSINQAFQDTLGYSMADLLGNEYLSNLIIHNREKIKYHFNQTISGNVQRFQIMGNRKNGKALIFDVTYIPMVVDKQVVGVYGIARDVTARRKVEKDLKLARERLESFIDHNVDPILIFNNDDRVIRVNKSFENVLGWKAGEILGLKLDKLPYIIKEDQLEVANKVRQIKNGKPWESHETKRIRKDGTLLNVLISGFPLQKQKRGIDGWAIIMRDITEQKQAEELFVRSEKLSIAGQLAAGIAHEIRNPMTAIKGFIQLIKSDLPDKPEYFDIITSEISRIELILSELLILAKPQTITISSIEIHSLINEVITLLNTEAILNNVEIIKEYYEEEIFIQCEINQIKQVCINFIKNAIEAMPSGGSLTIQIRLKDTHGVHIRFMDEGCGIPESVLEKLGQPFYTTKEKGTGLGYMVSKKIIENHKGTIMVTSKVNQGSVFEVFLPLNAIESME
ncbi:MAG: PAS domain S-box protein [Heyndrickxia sp.]